MKKKVQERAEVPQAADFLLSVIIPCYNESARVGLMMNGIADFDKKWKGRYEVIIVDDGSKDDTVDKIASLLDGQYQSLKDKVSLLKMPANGGKGEALKLGVASCTGDYFLTLDADMSTAPAEIINWQRLKPEMFKENRSVYIGSRRHKDSDVKALNSRRFVGGIFNGIVQICTGLPITDTQCGFKLYPAGAKKLFASMKNSGWAHDVELLCRARDEQYGIEEMPISWENREESKVNVMTDSVVMLFQVMMIALRLWLSNTFTAPFKMAGLDTNEKKRIIYRSVFNVLCLLLLIVMPILSQQYAVTGDEHWHRDYGTDIYNYFFHGSHNAQTTDSGIQYYGGLFDFITAFCFYTFHFASHYKTMHFLNALVGAIGIIYAGKLARFLGGTKAGIITIILLVCSPSYFGHSFANPKDIPFAAGYIASIYYIILYASNLPRQSFRVIAGLVLSIGFAMGVRIGGLLLIAYLFMAVAGVLLFHKASRTAGLKGILLNLCLISGAAYLIAIICWPYAHLGIISKPLESLKVMSNFFITIDMLYGGRHIHSNQVPWYYIPKFILYTAPVIVLAGFVAGIGWVLSKWKYGKKDIIIAGFLLFTVIFPPAYAIYKHSSLYDGWRHFLFIYVPLTVLAALGISMLIGSKVKAIKYVAVIVLAAGLIGPLRFTIAYHPMESLYFNEISGGLKKMYGNYEIDYYMVGIKPATEWLLQQEGVKNKPIVVATNCTYPVTEYLAPYKNISVVYVRLYERYTKDWDYCIFFSRFVDRSQLVSGNWPLPETIHTVDVEGVPVASVLKRKTHEDFKGYELLKKNDLAGAKAAFFQALAANPANDEVWTTLMQVYQAEQQPDSVLFCGYQALKTYPASLEVIEAMGNVYLKRQQNDSAFHLYDKLEVSHPEYVHILKAYALAIKGDAAGALNEIDEGLALDNANPQALQMGIQIAQQAKDFERLEKYQGIAEQQNESAQ